MKVKLNTADYDSYTLLIPLSHFFGRKRNIYLNQELEKLHPCFSDSFVFDDRIRITKNGFVSDVTVMDKIRYGEYKTRYPNLSLKTNEGKTVFSDFHRKLYFWCFSAIFLFVLLFPLMKFWINSPAEVEDIEEISIEDKDPAENTVLLIPALYEIFLPEIKKQNGKIDYLSWKYDGYKENFEIKIVGFYPTDLETELKEMNCSTATVKNGTPEFLISRERTVLSAFRDSEPVSIKVFSKEIRREMVEKGFSLESESYEPYRIRMLGNTENFIELLENSESIQKLLDEAGYVFSELIFKANEGAGVFLEIAFLPHLVQPFARTFLEVLNEVKEIVPVKKQSPVRVVNKTNAGEVKTMRKIGEISHQGKGSRMFYLNTSGRVENEITE